MSSTCVVGLQWGDEAKGKIVDWLCDRHDVVVRYQGGANAGHTVVADGVTYKLSLIPTGILRPGIACVIGNGVVVHPPALLSEIETLTGQGVEAEGRLFISDRAHLILPYHLAEERLTEESISKADHLGTTRRGIGPCYRDKVGRVHGVRVGDLYHPTQFAEHVGRIVAYKNRLLTAMLPDFTPLDAGDIVRDYLGFAERLRPYVRDTTSWLHGALGRGQKLLFEGGAGIFARHRSRDVPVCDQLQQQRRRDRGGLGGADPAHRPLAGNHQGLYDPRRWRPVPDRAG